MKKVICLLMMCLLVLFFGLGSDALAGKKLVVNNTEWLIQGTAKMYLVVEDAEINSPQAEAKKPKGPYLGSMVGGIGLAVFYEPENGGEGVVAPLVATGDGVIAGASANYTLDTYTVKGKKITAISGSVTITAPNGDPIETYDGPVAASFNVNSKKGTFSGKFEYTNEGVLTQIQVSGRLLGKFEDLLPPP